MQPEIDNKRFKFLNQRIERFGYRPRTCLVTNIAYNSDIAVRH